jgi:mercuric ion binding protein
MKTIKLFFVAFMALTFVNSFAQMNDHDATSNTKTETFKVWGNCGTCKARIEKAAKIDGVSKADWDKNTQILTLSYNPDKVKSDDVQKKIAGVGHDTEKFKADDKVYNKLPMCCQYERKK